MTAIHHLTAPLTESELCTRIYRGELLVFREFQAMARLTERLRSCCDQYLGKDPYQAHRSMSYDAIEQAVDELGVLLKKDVEVAADWRQVMLDVGVHLESTFGDGIVIRVQPPANAHSGRRTQPLNAHRDSWGSNLAPQINWWAPLYETTPERTLALFPGKFSQMVENNSADWNFKEMVRAIRQGGKSEYPLLPTATIAPNWEEALIISLLPGDLLCFSGAHLHASVPNTTELTRLSFETRTVNQPDLTAGHGAPNVDGAAPFATPHIFKNLENGQRLGELVVVGR